MLPYRVPSRVMRKTGRSLLIVAAAVFSTTLPLIAQRFHETIGGISPASVSGSAIVEAANGDFISAGVGVPSGGAPRAYIVRTDATGIRLWQNDYLFWGASSSEVTDIKEYANGDFIAVGTVRHTLFGLTSQAFAMRLTSAGALVWVTTVAGNYQFNEASAVVIARQGSGAAQPGDVVLAGTTRNLSAYDGLLARIDGNGSVVWFKTYDIPGGNTSTTDVLYDLDETQITSAEGTIGDIVAVGGTSGIPQDYLFGVWVLRVDGTTGTIGTRPYGSAIYGTSQDEYGYSIQELRNGAHAGDLVITGSSAGAPGAASHQIFAMQLHAWPCDPLNPRAITSLSNFDGWGACVREITSAKLGTVGNAIVTGTINNGPFGGSDVILQEFQEGTMAPVGQSYLYGGTDNDDGESLTEVLHAPNTQGYAIAGYTVSPDLISPGTGQALYLIRNDSLMTNVCKYATDSPVPDGAEWSHICTAITASDQQDAGSALVMADPAPWYEYHACYSPEKPAVPGAHIRIGADATLSSVQALACYPNPVRHVDNLTLAYTLTAPDTVHVAVTDLLGRTVHEHSRDGSEGQATELIPTTSWNPGTYLACVRTNGHVMTTRVVVLDR